MQMVSNSWPNRISLEAIATVILPKATTGGAGDTRRQIRPEKSGCRFRMDLFPWSGLTCFALEILFHPIAEFKFIYSYVRGEIS